MILKKSKECEIYFCNLEKIKKNVEEKVRKMEIIPDDWMEEYKREYANFSKCYFAKKLRIPGVKKHILKTLAQIKGYKEKIEKTPAIIKIFMVDLVNNYSKFLEMSEMMCRDFLKRL
jgi:deoxyadenosine/deoxycytidine kinase